MGAVNECLEILTQILHAEDSVLKVPKPTRDQFVLRTIDENLERLRKAEFGRQKHVLGHLVAEQFLDLARRTERSRDVDAAIFRASQHFRLIANDWDVSNDRRAVAGFVAHKLANLMDKKSPELISSTSELAIGAEQCSNDDWIAITGMSHVRMSQLLGLHLETRTEADELVNKRGSNDEGRTEADPHKNVLIPVWAELGRPNQVSARWRPFGFYFRTVAEERDVSDARLIEEVVTGLLQRQFENAGRSAALLLSRIGTTWSPVPSVEGRRTMNLLQAAWHLSFWPTSVASQRRLTAVSICELTVGIDHFDDLREEFKPHAISDLDASDPISKEEWVTLFVRLLGVFPELLTELKSQEVSTLTDSWQLRTQRQKRPMSSQIRQEVSSWRREVLSVEEIDLRGAPGKLAKALAILRPILLETEVQILESLKSILALVAQAESSGENDREKIVNIVALEDRITELTSNCFSSNSGITFEVACPYLCCILDALERAKTHASETSRPELSLTLLSDRLPLRSLSMPYQEIAIDFEIANVGNSDARQIVLEYTSASLETSTRSAHATAIRPSERIRLSTTARLTSSIDALDLAASLRWRNDLGLEFQTDQRYIAEAERPSRWTSEDCNPYSTNAVNNRESLFGRDEQLDNLRDLLVQGHSVVITGQKRVGKSSLITVACREIESTVQLATVERYAYLQARSSKSFIRNFVDHLGYRISRLVDGIDIGPFDPQDDRVSLMAGRRLTEIGAALGNKKIVFVIDDFDELPSELLDGSDGDELFNFIRAAAQEQWLSIVFIGSEVMPKMLSRHAARLNTFNSVSVDRIESMQGMANLITKPTIDRLEWSDEAVVSLTQYVDGNPYYAVLVCIELWSRLRDRDRSYVTERDVIECVREFASRADRRHFVHLWGDSEDGMAPESEVADLNIYLLYAIGRYSGDGGACRQDDVLDWVQGRIEGKSRSSIEDRISDLISRKVLAIRADGLLRIRIPLVNLWFRHGAEENIGDRLRDFVDSARLSDQISNQDLLVIADGLRFAGRDITEVQVGAWLEQFTDASLRASTFRMLQTLKANGYFSLERIEELGSTYRGSLDTGPLAKAIRKSANGRSTENVIVVPVFPCDYEVARRFAKGASFPQSSVLRRAEFNRGNFSGAKAVVVVFASFDGGGSEVRQCIEELLSRHLTDTSEFELQVVILTSLSDAATVDFDGEVRFRRRAMTLVSQSCTPLAIRNSREGGFDISDVARERLVRQQTDLLEDAPGGWDEFGLLVVFDGVLPTYSPAIFWKSGRYQGKEWRPLFASSTSWDGARPAKSFSRSKRLIEGGEKPSVEFKETMRSPADGSQSDKVIRAALEGAVVKAVASLLNHDEGGTLFIGVRDDKTVAGLELDFLSFSDGDRNEDGFERHLREILRRDIADLQPAEVDIHFEFVDGLRVCVVQCPPARKPRFVLERSNGRAIQRLYVRDGPRSIDISTEGQTMFNFLQNRFDVD